MYPIPTFLLAFFVLTSTGPLAAQSIDCAPVVPRGGQNLTTEIRGDLDTKIGGIASKLVNLETDIAGLYREFKVDTLQSYDDNAKLYAWERFIYIKCDFISKSSFSDAEKSKQLDDLIMLYLQGPEMIKSNSSSASENDYFLVRVKSTKKSSDGKRLILTLEIRARENTNAFISLVNNSARAVDNEAGFYQLIDVFGIDSDRCGGIFFQQNFTHLTPSSTHTVTFVLFDESGSKGDLVSFSASLCTTVASSSLFRLPVSVANISLGEPTLDNGKSLSSSTQVSERKFPPPPESVMSPDIELTCALSIELKPEEWAEFRMTGTTYSFLGRDRDPECIMIWSDGDGSRRACPGQRISIKSNGRLWFRTEKSILPAGAMCFEGLGRVAKGVAGG